MEVPALENPKENINVDVEKGSQGSSVKYVSKSVYSEKNLSHV